MNGFMKYRTYDRISKYKAEYTCQVKITGHDKKNFYLVYEELKVKHIVKINIDGETVQFNRIKPLKSKLLFEKNHIISNNYVTEYGTIKVDTKLNKLILDDDELIVEYQLFQQGQCVGDFNITLKKIRREELS